jgi:hypothetical protein
MIVEPLDGLHHVLRDSEFWKAASEPNKSFVDKQNSVKYATVRESMCKGKYCDLLMVDFVQKSNYAEDLRSELVYQVW